MLGVLSRKLSALEAKVDLNTKQIKDLQQMLIIGENEDENPGANSDCRMRLFRLQAQMKQISFQLNSVFLKVCKHDRQLQEMCRFRFHGTRSDCLPGPTMNYHGSASASSNQTVYNPLANEFYPKAMSSADMNEVGDGSGRPEDDELMDASYRPHYVPHADDGRTLEPGHPEHHGYLNKPGHGVMHTSFLHGNLVFQNAHTPPPGATAADQVVPGSPLSPNPNDRVRQQNAAKLGVVKPQDGPNPDMYHIQQRLLPGQEHMGEMDPEVNEKDDELDELSRGKDHTICREHERELRDKQDWYEHKLRLLKQDKRRRGETIGKLIRCLDELRESGRVAGQMTSQDGQLVMAAALASRHWPPEHRVHAAVQAMEAERAAHRACMATEVPSAEVSMTTTTNSSDSPRPEPPAPSSEHMSQD